MMLMELLMIICRVQTFQMIALFLAVIWTLEYLQAREKEKKIMAQAERLLGGFRKKFKAFLEKYRNYYPNIYKGEPPFPGWYLTFKPNKTFLSSGPTLFLGGNAKEAEEAVDNFTAKYLEDRLIYG